VNKPENRVDKIISDLLQGRRLKLRAGDAEEKAAITAAARMVAASQGPHRMNPAFRKRLEQTLESAPRGEWLTRRGAMVAGLGIAAGVVTGGLVGRSMQPAATAKPPVTGGPIDPIGGRWTDVAALSDLAEGQGMRVTAGGVSAFVFRRGETVSAVSSICSHLPCELWWDGPQGLLDCPCHPVSFTPAGKATETSYPLPDLNTVRVRVTSAGRVEVLGTV
jgi:nitrite reductase/ring-hydroxylating ferredoxin subunit